MRIKLKHFSLILLIFILAVSAFPAPVLAGPQIPATPEGPGFILPDSPFFFLDEVKQNIRIFLAIRPQDKAEVFNSIAGERIAELRFMLADNNQKGIEIALEGISQNTQAAADSLAEAQFHGNNVEKLAENLNTDIKRRQEGLDVLLASSDGELKAMVLGTQTSIYNSKTKVIEGLSQEKKEIEKKEGQTKEAGTDIIGGVECSKDISDKLDSLKQQIDKVPAKNEKKSNLKKQSNPKQTTGKGTKEELNKAFENLKLTAEKCVDANEAFKAAYNEFNKLLNNNSQSTTSVK